MVARGVGAPEVSPRAGNLLNRSPSPAVGGMVSDMGSNRSSLQSRLILRLCAVFVAFFVLAGMVVFLIYHTDSEEIPFDVLAGDLHALKTAVTVQNDGRVNVDESKLPPSIGYMVRTLDGTVKLSGGRHADELQVI